MQTVCFGQLELELASLGGHRGRELRLANLRGSRRGQEPTASCHGQRHARHDRASNFDGQQSSRLRPPMAAACLSAKRLCPSARLAGLSLAKFDLGHSYRAGQSGGRSTWRPDMAAARSTQLKSSPSASSRLTVKHSTLRLIMRVRRVEPVPLSFSKLVFRTTMCETHA